MKVDFFSFLLKINFLVGFEMRKKITALASEQEEIFLFQKHEREKNMKKCVL
jgi:hypothetical protein